MAGITQAEGGYRNLAVYRMAHSLAVTIHELSLQLPKHELYEIGSQLRRASKSVSANIVEGYSRKEYQPEFARYLTYALGSCNETAEWLLYIQDCHPGLLPQCGGLMQEAEHLAKQIRRLIQSVGRTRRGSASNGQ